MVGTDADLFAIAAALHLLVSVIFLTLSTVSFIAPHPLFLFLQFDVYQHAMVDLVAKEAHLQICTILTTSWRMRSICMFKHYFTSLS
jgi:hypothetical protein